jgi:flagellar assembly protein FliH
MTKVVFRNGELVLGSGAVLLESPERAEEEAASVDIAEVHPAEVYEGPTVDDIRKEAEDFKKHWDTDRESLILSAKMDAEEIVKKAEATAFQTMKRKTGEVQALKQEAQDEADRIIAEARKQAEEIEAAGEAAVESRRRDAEEEGLAAGREAGYGEGRAEVERLIARTRVALERAQEKRLEILAGTEQQLIDLTLLIARKVIKVISESQKEVIIANVSEALKKVKGKGTVILRVNTADLALSTEHAEDFIRQLEGSSTIQVQEDSSVDPGGCVIETDFGEIDARIASQLAELESRILDMSPIRSGKLPAQDSESK